MTDFLSDWPKLATRNFLPEYGMPWLGTPGFTVLPNFMISHEELFSKSHFKTIP